jgi:hypothetical protein
MTKNCKACWRLKDAGVEEALWNGSRAQGLGFDGPTFLSSLAVLLVSFEAEVICRSMDAWPWAEYNDNRIEAECSDSKRISLRNCPKMRPRHTTPPVNGSVEDQSSAAVVNYRIPNTTEAVLCLRPLNKYILSLIYTLH